MGVEVEPFVRASEPAGEIPSAAEGAPKDPENDSITRPHQGVFPNSFVYHTSSSRRAVSERAYSSAREQAGGTLRFLRCCDQSRKK